MERVKELGLNLTEEEVAALRASLGRDPNDLELAMVDSEWSEHCSYKSSKQTLKLLPTEGKHVVLGPGHDAGVLDVGDNWVIAAHIESHNHPSAIDPYGGSATGVGGVLRDILCIGTRPIALLDLLRFGPITQSQHSKWLFRNVVRGISDYGNCVGVPTVGGEVEFDESFERNCLVDVVSVGLGKRSDIILAEAKYLGDAIVLVGGLTGRDGMHGSSFASATLNENSDMDRSAVQIPDPFTKKLIIEATLEALKTGHVRGLKDLGGGGLSCGLSEIADRGKKGIDVDLSKIPLREHNMDPLEVMISESQERMLFVIEQGWEEKVCSIFDKYRLRNALIGRATENTNLEIRKDGVTLAEIPSAVLANAPLISRKSKKPNYIDSLAKITALKQPSDYLAMLKSILALPNISSKRWVYEQYDHEVGIRTVTKPGQAGASVLRLPNGKFLALRADGNSRHSFLDPYQGSAGAMAEASRNIIAVGAKPIGMLDHIQFGDPGNPEVFWSFEQSVKGIADYSRSLEIPCIGGKVSFYNEDKFTNKAIKPSPVITVIGLIDQQKDLMGPKFCGGSNVILVVGMTRSEMGGSEYYEEIHKITGGQTPKVDFEYEKRLHKSVLAAIKLGYIKSIDDCSKGGLAVTLAEMCIQSELGATVNLDQVPTDCIRLDEILFSESHGRFIIEAEQNRCEKLKLLFKENNVPCEDIGFVNNSGLIIKSNGKEIINVKVDEVRAEWSLSIPRLMGES